MDRDMGKTGTRGRSNVYQYMDIKYIGAFIHGY